MIVVALEDSDTVSKVVAVAEAMGLPVVLSGAPQQAAQELPDSEGARLLVMDVDARRLGGLGILQRIHQTSDLLIVAVGEQPENARAVEALSAGADCYLSRPVDAALLKACLEALLRRWHRISDRGNTVTVRGLTVNFTRKEISLNGEPVAVTPAEFRLLACLANHLGKVVPSSKLLKEISGYDCPEAEAQEIVKVHISRLRSKIDRDPNSPSYIVNVRGFGYLLERRGAAPGVAPAPR